MNFSAGGVATPADAALMMQLGAEGVFVGSGIFKSEDPEQMAKAIVKATTHFQDAEIIAEVSRGTGTAMKGLEIGAIRQTRSGQARLVGVRSFGRLTKMASAGRHSFGATSSQAQIRPKIRHLGCNIRR